MARVPVSETANTLAHIDVLRGIAIVAVVMCHHAIGFAKLPGAALVTAFGRSGVQLFFVASAVTLCRSAERRSAEARPLFGFAVRRLFRIAPLYYFGLALYALVRAAVPWAAPRGDSADLYSTGNVVANLLFVHGFSARAYNHVVPGGWSIAAEMSFYALFPLLFPLAGRMERVGGVRALAAATGGVWVAGVAVQVLQWRIAGFSPGDPFVYSGIANQLPVFLVGMIAWFAVERGERLRDDGKWFGLLVLIVMVLLLRPIPLVDQIVPVLAAFACLFLLSIVRSLVRDGGLLARVGRRSYSMYILHFLPVWVVGAAAERYAPTSQALLYLPTLVASLGATYAVAGMTERWIERPFIAIGRRWIVRNGCFSRPRLYGDPLPPTCA